MERKAVSARESKREKKGKQNKRGRVGQYVRFWTHSIPTMSENCPILRVYDLHTLIFPKRE